MSEHTQVAVPPVPNESIVTALVFKVAGFYYAVDVHVVYQILWIPELSPVEEVPYFQVGIFNLRGQEVNVVDLNLRFGHPAESCCRSDSIVVLSLSQGLVGVVAQEILDVMQLTLLSGDIHQENDKRLLAGKAQMEDEMVMLLNHDMLLPAIIEPGKDLVERPRFCPDLNDADRQIMHQRSLTYRNLDEDEDSEQLLEIVIVDISGERFGLLVSEVSEFSDIDQLTCVPCCPSYVLGNMNLRGEILTVFDISRVLELPEMTFQKKTKLIVYQHQEQLLGVIVNKIFEIRIINSSSIKQIPVALGKKGTDFLWGELTDADGIVSLVNIQHVIENGGLTVNEEV